MKTLSLALCAAAFVTAAHADVFHTVCEAQPGVDELYRYTVVADTATRVAYLDVASRPPRVTALGFVDNDHNGRVSDIQRRFMAVTSNRTHYPNRLLYLQDPKNDYIFIVKVVEPDFIPNDPPNPEQRIWSISPTGKVGFDACGLGE